MSLLVALLVVTFAIAADLAHEAWSTAQSQARSSERAAQNLVRFAATSGADESQAALSLGLRALFGEVLPGRASPAGRKRDPEVLAASALRIRECRCAPVLPARYYFRLTLGSGELVLTGDTAAIDASERRWLRDTLALRSRPSQLGGGEIPLVYDAARRHLVAFVEIGEAVRDTVVYGMSADIAAVGEAVFAPVAGRRTQPRAGSVATLDSSLRVFVLAPDGHRVYDANPRRVEQLVTMVPQAGHEAYLPGVATVKPVVLLADTVSLGPDYGNLSLAVALAPSEPAIVFEGGVPRSRLFVLFGLLVLMAGLIVTAVLQLRREQELARLRADLTAGVSHELRTPLAQIMLYGETLMLDRTRTDRERRAAAEVIVREARRLMHLVENALHFARADRRVLVLSPEAIDVGELTRDILVSFAPLAWAAQVQLREQIDGATPAIIDAAAYRQIVLNLLENAVRYGPPGQTITIAVISAGTVVRLVVEDQGPGVEAADRERIWAPFVRLRASRQGPLGTGIGLAVVRDLVLRHGGRSWVERAQSGGARFVVELPSTRNAIINAAVEPSGSAPRRIAR
jgi:signal transduction histidine kinase